MVTFFHGLPLEEICDDAISSKVKNSRIGKSMMAQQELHLRGRLIGEDDRGNLRLDDIWKLAGEKVRKSPSGWRMTRQARELIAELQQRITTDNVGRGLPNFRVVYEPVGTASDGTYAHPILAAAYAGFLSPKLEIEVREIWLRFRSGDASLADEILQKATAEENRRVGIRALGRSQRKSYTAVLKDHGVSGWGYGACTNAIYVKLLGGKSEQVLQLMGLTSKSKLRDELPADKLAYIMASEALSSERIEEESRFGNEECVQASSISAGAINSAIEADRKNRQKRLIV